jgi:hypothetical protein
MPASDNRGSLEKNRKNEYQNAYPFDGVDVSKPEQVQQYLDKVNAGLADTESGLLYTGLKPGMAGSEGEPYAIPSPGMDSMAGVSIQKV